MRNEEEIANKAVDEWFAYQNKLELEFALRSVSAFRPEIILEIGVAYGSTLAAWKAVTNAKRAIGIDPLTLPKTPQQQASFDNLVKTYDLDIIPHRSEEPEAQTKLKEILGDKKVDFLFIDAEHLIENTKYDFTTYLPYMNTPSLIGFHDIYYSDVLAKAGTGVYLLWERLKKIYSYDEIHFHSSMGIGFIYYPTKRADMFMPIDL